MPEIGATDVTKIAAPLDFLGVNYATYGVIRDDPAPPIMAARVPREDQSADEAARHTNDGLFDILTRVQQEYAPAALLITGNGTPESTSPDAAGLLDDPA